MSDDITKKPVQPPLQDIAPPASPQQAPTTIAVVAPVGEVQQAPQDGHAVSGSHDADAELEKIASEVNVEQKLAEAHKAHKAKPVIIMTIAIVVAACLGVAAFFAFSGTKPLQSSNNQSASKTSDAQPNTSNIAKTSVSTEDLTKASDDISKKLDALNEDKDFSANDVSDQSLGLQ